MAQLASAWLSEGEVSGSIFSDFNVDVCFDFRLIRVALALNTRKTEHWQRQGGKERTGGFHWYQCRNWRNKVTSPLPLFLLAICKALFWKSLWSEEQNNLIQADLGAYDLIDHGQLLVQCF